MASAQVTIPHRQLLSLLAQPFPEGSSDAAAGAAPAAAPAAALGADSQPAAAASADDEDAVTHRVRPLRPFTARQRRAPGGTAAASGSAAAASSPAGEAVPSGRHAAVDITAVPASNAAGGASAAADLASSGAGGGATPSDSPGGSTAAPAVAPSSASGRRSAASGGTGGTAGGRPPRSCGGSGGGGGQPHRVTEAHISLLLNAGLLARHATDRGLYLFGVPDTGPLVHFLADAWCPSPAVHALILCPSAWRTILAGACNVTTFSLLNVLRQCIVSTEMRPTDDKTLPSLAHKHEEHNKWADPVAGPGVPPQQPCERSSLDRRSGCYR